MRINKLKSTLGMIAFAMSACATIASAGNATMTVNIKGLKASGGALYVSVQDRQQFDGKAITAGGRYENTKAGDKTFIYKDVPEGEYAVMLWHDLDNDGAFTQDEVTYMPLDGWGASGSELRGRPTFETTKVALTPQGLSVDLKMHYPK